MHDSDFGAIDYRRVGWHRKRHIAHVRRRLHADQRQLRRRFFRHEAGVRQSVGASLGLLRDQFRRRRRSPHRDRELLPRPGQVIVDSR